MVRRGDVVIATIGGGIGNKPRPAVIIQEDDFGSTETVLMIPFTSDIPAILVSRPYFAPNIETGLNQPCVLMVDKLLPVRRKSIGEIIGQLSTADMERVERALLIMLGVARG